MDRTPGSGSGVAEPLLVWATYTATVVAVTVTYARLPPEQLYHVSGSGIDAGLGRALVFANFPAALAAVAVLLVVADRLPRRPLATAAVAVAIALCCVTAWPGVVDQSDLDARLANVVPAVGVLLALALTALAARASGAGSLRPWRGGDGARIGAAAVLIAVATPWLFAELGFYADDVPGLGRVFMSDELRVNDDGTVARAVHPGEHHGTDGVLLAATAIVLSRTLGTLRSPRLGLALGAYLALMLVYGLANAAQDAWLEQVVKRGWSERHLPDVLQPEPTVEWAVLLASAAVVYVLLLRPLGARAAVLSRTRRSG